jgi:acyl-CoA synthetase (AMP-forming)/AMP-acid ligase II
VNPEAVERVLASHPCVADAVCFAEPHPVLGLVPIAEIVMREGAWALCRAHGGPCNPASADPSRGWILGRFRETGAPAPIHAPSR